MRFRNREEAGRNLAGRLLHLKKEKPVILALPRGGVPIGFEIAKELEAPLDLLIIKKIGAPGEPELAIGAVAEDGTIWMNHRITQQLGLIPEEVEASSRDAKSALKEIVKTLRSADSQISIRNRAVILVDDGIATGSTLLAAVETLRHQGVARLIVASPVSSLDASEKLKESVDEFICLSIPPHFSSVSQWYESFHQVSNETVLALLLESRAQSSFSHQKPPSILGHFQEVQVSDGNISLAGELSVPREVKAWVIFAHGSGSNYQSPRNLQVARALNGHGFGTLLFNLLTPEEGSVRHNVFNIELLANRLAMATRWMGRLKKNSKIPIGYFGASTGAAAAIQAAASFKNEVFAIVSRGGRPDLAKDFLEKVQAPTLLMVGSLDTEVIELNRIAEAQLPKAALVVISGATHLFEEPGKLEEVSDIACQWFSKYLPDTRSRHLASRI